jgi:hypothetical protein
MTTPAANQNTVEQLVRQTLEKEIECLRCHYDKYMPTLLKQHEVHLAGKPDDVTPQQGATILVSYLIMHWARTVVMYQPADILANAGISVKTDSKTAEI